MKNSLLIHVDLTRLEVLFQPVNEGIAAQRGEITCLRPQS